MENINKQKIKLPVLSKRLKAIADFVNSYDVVADIGCDHAYLAIYLAMKKSKLVYAVDINEKPLSRARKNIEKYCVLDKVKLILSDGLKNVPHSVDTVIISGIGGKLISKIIFSEQWLKDRKKHLILQPQTFLTKLREDLYLNGFEIEDEMPVVETKRSYCVISARYIGNVKKLSIKQAVLGKLEEYDTAEANEFLKRQYASYNKALKGLKLSGLDKQKINTYMQICNILSKWV
ncbi:MAG: class I SAM-dependent methyltransferase [Oscillospiraceae bacterium]|nr:class I SAM-dependent methyltransferase [Oscillospiraceae bacterium]